MAWRSGRLADRKEHRGPWHSTIFDKEDRLIGAGLLTFVAGGVGYIGYVTSDPRKPIIAVVFGAMTVTTLLLALWIFDKRFNWAGRLISAEMFALSLLYLHHEWHGDLREFLTPKALNQPSGLRALLLFATLGVPSLSYAIFGRYVWQLSWRKSDSTRR